MRILEFIVNKQQLMQNPECDFSSIIAGTKDYLKAKFQFSEEWDGCRKAASFWLNGCEYATLLDDNDECAIPSEVLTRKSFLVSLTGKGDYKITTNKLKIRLGAGNYGDSR